MSRLRVLAAVLLVANGIGAAGWLVWGQTPDCVTVNRVGHQWALMTAAFDEITDRVADGDDMPGVSDESLAEMQSAMSEKLRVAADSVTDSAIAQALTDWADSAELNAAIQRDPPPDEGPEKPWPPQETLDQVQRASILYRDATTALDRRCPGLKTVLHTA